MFGTALPNGRNALWYAIRMPAAIYDIVVEQGTTFSPSFTWENPDRTPIDLTGYKAKIVLSNKRGKGSIKLAEYTTETGEISLGGPLGTISIYINPMQTTAFEFSTAEYDFNLIDPNGDIERLIQGTVTLKHSAG